MPESGTYRYGIVDPSVQDGRKYQVENFVEKSVKGTAPSNLAIMGRYILTPEIFMFLDQQEKGAGGEFRLQMLFKSLIKFNVCLQ